MHGTKRQLRKLENGPTWKCRKTNKSMDRAISSQWLTLVAIVWLEWLRARRPHAVALQICLAKRLGLDVEPWHVAARRFGLLFIIPVLSWGARVRVLVRLLGTERELASARGLSVLLLVEESRLLGLEVDWFVLVAGHWSIVVLCLSLKVCWFKPIELIVVFLWITIQKVFWLSLLK